MDEGGEDNMKRGEEEKKKEETGKDYMEWDEMKNRSQVDTIPLSRCRGEERVGR